MTTTELTLDERAAKVLGRKYRTLPAFSRSIDAQRPLEEMARALGWRLYASNEFADGGFTAAWEHVQDGYRRATAPTEAEARLLCLLEVLEGTK